MAHRLLLAENTVQTGNVIANTTTETTFASQIPFPANLDNLSNAGRLYRLRADGYISSLVTTPGTLTLKIKWGAMLLAASAAIQLPATALNNNHFELTATALICLTGTSGRIACQGGGFIDAAGAPISFGFVNIGTGTGGQITVNTQSAANLNVSATFSVANAANSVTLAQLICEELT